MFSKSSLYWDFQFVTETTLHPEYIQKLKPAVLGAEILRVVEDPNAVLDAQACASELQTLLRPQGRFSVVDWLTQADLKTAKSDELN